MTGNILALRPQAPHNPPGMHSEGPLVFLYWKSYVEQDRIYSNSLENIWFIFFPV